MITVDSLSARGIVVTLVEPGRLKLASDKPVDPRTIEQIQTAKPMLVEELASRCVHTDPAKYRDHPSVSRQGWVETTCVVCGRFIGNRPR